MIYISINNIFNILSCIEIISFNRGFGVLGIDKNENLLVIKGSIPGKAGNLITIKAKK